MCFLICFRFTFGWVGLCLIFPLVCKGSTFYLPCWKCWSEERATHLLGTSSLQHVHPGSGLWAQPLQWDTEHLPASSPIPPVKAPASRAGQRSHLWVGVGYNGGTEQHKQKTWGQQPVELVLWGAAKGGAFPLILRGRWADRDNKGGCAAWQSLIITTSSEAVKMRGALFFPPTSQNSTRQPLSTGSDVLTFVPWKHPLHHPFCSVHGAGRAAHLEMEPGKPLEEQDTSSGLTF